MIFYWHRVRTRLQSASRRINSHRWASAPGAVAQRSNLLNMKQVRVLPAKKNGQLPGRDVFYWLPVCNPLHNRSLSLAVNRKPSISTDYQRSGRSRRGRSGVDPDFIPLPDNHQISWLVPGFFDFIDHNMVKPLKIALCQFLQGSNRLFEGQSLLRQQIEIFFGNPKIARACVDRLV